MIKIENVSMKFNLGVETDNSLKMIFIRLFNPKKRNKKQYFWALKDIDFNRFLDKGKEIVFDTNINKFVIKNKLPLIEKNTPIENNTNKVLSKIKKERRSWNK